MHSSRKSLVSLVSALVLILPTVSAQATTRNVPSQYSTIQAAISTAISGDTIVIAAGSYPASGSYPGRLIWASKNLTIRGTGAGKSFIIPSYGSNGCCLTIRNLSAASRISGFTFTNGQVYNDFGGGIYCDFSNLTVDNCTFENNQADKGGSGMYIRSGSPTISYCTFNTNKTIVYGGEIYNQASSPIITNCTFTNNRVGAGAAIFNEAGSAIVTNCTFGGNMANQGGGMCIEQSSPTITNCTFIGNSASTLPDYYGGSYDGGGMFNGYGNQTVTNCIFWGNTGGGIRGFTASANVSYSDVQDLTNTTPDANGNFAASPLFVNPAGNNVRLQAGSPCRDRSNNAVLLSPPFLSVTGNVIFDLDTCRRLPGSRVDLGAYEFQSLTDVNAQLLILPFLTASNSTTGENLQVLIIKNTGGTDLNGPISLIITGLSGYTLFNRTRETSALTPAGRPYINLPGALAPGEQVTTGLKFTKMGSGAFSYGSQVVDGYGTR